MEQVKIFNRRLIEYFGYAPNADNKPLFRVVNTSGLLEKRSGVFDKFYKGMIWVGQFCGVRECKKYSFLPEDEKGRWAVEVYSATTYKAYDIIKKSDNYEPVWVFNKDNQYQELWWPAVEYICKQWIKQVTTKGAKRNEKMDFAREEEKIQNDAARIEDMLDISSPLQSRFHFKEAILLPGKDF